jgi:hypothetical protein
MTHSPQQALRSSDILPELLKESNRLHWRNRLFMSLLATSALVGTFAPHFLPSFSKESKLSLLASGIASTSAFFAMSQLNDRKNKVHNALYKANNEAIKHTLSRLIVEQKIIGTIDGKRQIAAFVDSLPAHERPRWVAEYDLHNLLTPQYAPEDEYEALNAKPDVAVLGSQSSLGEMKKSMAVDWDFSWLDEEFVTSSKIVVGDMGSGKSSYLALEAKLFLEHNEDGELRISDTHYDEEESKWLLGVPPEVLKDKYLVDTVEATMDIFEYMYAELNRRIENKDRKGHPIKFICDEYIAFMESLNPAQVTRLTKILTLFGYQSRKYNMYITLGLHSLKQKMNGIDSSILNNFYQLFLGDSLSDITVKTGANFDIKKICEELEILRRAVPKNEGFPVTAKRRNSPPQTCLLPFIGEEDYKVNYIAAPKDSPKSPTENPKGDRNTSPEALNMPRPSNKIPDYYQEMKVWIASLSSFPSDGSLWEKWQELTGQRLHTAGLKALKDFLSKP